MSNQPNAVTLAAIAESYAFREGSVGLTKREYFAGLALQAILSIPSYQSKGPPSAAFEAVCYADALISELSKNKETPA